VYSDCTGLGTEQTERECVSFTWWIHLILIWVPCYFNLYILSTPQMDVVIICTVYFTICYEQS
jgi:hypothetical protein